MTGKVVIRQNVIIEMKMLLILLHCSFVLPLSELDSLDGKVPIVDAKKREKKDEQKLPDAPLRVEHCVKSSLGPEHNDEKDDNGLPLASLSFVEFHSFSLISLSLSLRLPFSLLSFSLISISISLSLSLRLPLSLLSFSLISLSLSLCLPLSLLSFLREMKSKTNSKRAERSLCLSKDDIFRNGKRQR